MKWPAREFSTSLELPLPRAAVWEVLADTDRLNRLVGLAAVDFAELDADPGIVRGARTRVAGLPLRWRESPFQWEKLRGYTVRREYSSGPLALFQGGIALEDCETGTRVRIFADIAPSGYIGKAVLAKVARSSLEKTAVLLRDFATRGTPALGGARRPVVNKAALAAGLRDLEGSGGRPMRIAQLGDYLENRPERDVAAIRPHLLAREWGAPVLEVTRLCLHAVRSGLLNLQWAVLCPNCRVPKADYSSLASLQSTVHCDLCGIDYESQFDKFVEIRFSIHPAVRSAKISSFCIGGPAITPHVWTQKVLRAGETVTIPVPDIEPRLRLRVLRANHILPLRDTRAENPEVVLNRGGWSSDFIACPVLGDGITVTNRTGAEAVLALEEQDWNSEAVTAAQVTALQEFRDLFASEVLAPGHEVGIEQLTFFFSDLLASTELYERDGDAVAYGLVRRHFDVLRHHIATHNGAVVKTIGDSVMAVFFWPSDAMRAALAIQRCAADAFGPGNGFALRIGLHHGPAIAVNAEEHLDYFGRSVNIAARIETASQGGDVVVSEAMWSRPEVRRVLAEAAATVEPFHARLKGIERKIPLYRVAASPRIENLAYSPNDRRSGERRNSERRDAII